MYIYVLMEEREGVYKMTGRRKLPEGMKKRKLTLTCKPESIDFLNMYCDKYGLSISEIVDRAANYLKEKEKEN